MTSPSEPDPMKDGYTVATYFPPEADWEMVQRFLGRMHTLAEGYFGDRRGWDPFVVGHAGDVLHVGTDDHVYLSTGCVHENDVYPDGRTGHEYCESETGVCGQKTPGCCKGCGAPCTCPNHKKKESNIVDG